MEFNNQHRRMLQTLMTQPQWVGFEVFFESFMRKEFIQGSAKRETEWDTIWYLAGMEEAKRKLLEFKQSLEDEASIV